MAHVSFALNIGMVCHYEWALIYGHMVIIHYEVSKGKMDISLREMSRCKMDISLQDATLSWLVADEAVHRGVPTQHKDESRLICIVQGLNWPFW